ncbi:flagellar brake protein [Gilvimarinus sp. SDUM040013]|uniref:Flagellar brake protein n=1 Tax=Gilvimarinus gilvus TaxID=3058038 RepID=A0ABU4RSU5_9GAMM|nr:flagellar brake protein [Gilvimarinus sp. SDUM040013]MDO3388413.1 flagellar brake protein [Gilvimarinus sp. SDUM040013]MDX6847963.1 flagellar brake protein [Gilvimarinus sp. SDUM040013]
MDFAELKLPHGTSLQLRVTNSSGQPESFASRFVGALPGRSLILSVPRAAGKLARFRPGQRMAVRMMVANGVGVFAATVEAQSSEPFPLLYVSYPETVQFKGIRKSTRIAVELPISVENVSTISSENSKGLMADVSVSGARLELKDAVADIGDEIVVRTQVPVENLNLDWSIRAVVRSRVERSTQEQNQALPAVYGVEFVENAQESLLVLYAYVYSQIVADQTPQDSD